MNSRGLTTVGDRWPAGVAGWRPRFIVPFGPARPPTRIAFDRLRHNLTLYRPTRLGRELSRTARTPGIRRARYCCHSRYAPDVTRVSQRTSASCACRRASRWRTRTVSCSVRSIPEAPHRWRAACTASRRISRGVPLVIACGSRSQVRRWREDCTEYATGWRSMPLRRSDRPKWRCTRSR